MLTRPTKSLPPRRPFPEGAIVSPTPTPWPLPVPPREAAISIAPDLKILTYSKLSFTERLPALTEFVRSSAQQVPLSKHPLWLSILHNSLGHEPYALEASSEGRTVGYLPLALLDSIIFGKFLVSLPYLNTNGVVAASPAVQNELVSRAISLADELNVRHLELRNETGIDHPGLNGRMTSKVHLRLALPATTHELWKAFDPKVRNQVRKGEKNGFTISWDGKSLLESFYSVLSKNMRDLGSPVYGIELFREIVSTFPQNAEVCVVKHHDKPVAAALLLHGWGVTEVPSASSLREYNPSCANMLMYWHLLQRAIERGQKTFDFGRSTLDGNTYRFKKQWGADPYPAIWQYRMHQGELGEMRPDNPRYRAAIQLWRQLPVTLTRCIGPWIVRGIP